MSYFTKKYYGYNASTWRAGSMFNQNTGCKIAIILMAYVFIIYCIQVVNTEALCIFSLMEI